MIKKIKFKIPPTLPLMIHAPFPSHANERRKSHPRNMVYHGYQNVQLSSLRKKKDYKNACFVSKLRHSFLCLAEAQDCFSPMRTTFVRCHVFRPALEVLGQQLKLGKGQILQERDRCFDREEDTIGYGETREGLPLTTDEDTLRGGLGMVLQQAFGLEEDRFPWLVWLDDLDEVAGAFHG